MECTIIDKVYMGLGYSEEALKTMKDLKEHYPEEYKNLNFNQSDILLKYLKYLLHLLH